MADERRIQTDIDFLKKLSEPCEEGITRIGFTKTYRQGAEYLKDRMREVGLDVREDAIGNVYGTLAGTQKELPVILSGSHLDTVRCAGAYDGIAGVVCALEAARMIRENNVELKHSYEVVGIIEEEGTRFGQVLLGSKYVTGQFLEKHLEEIKDPDDGRMLKDILEEYALPDTCPAYRNDDEILAFLELHDEQGPILETEGIDIGVVENIVAISWLTISVVGFAGHAGTVPMPLRQDAIFGASRLIQEIIGHTTAQYSYQATATIGKLQVQPGSSNCIPSKCIFTVDLRSGQMDNIEALIKYIRESAAEIEKECHVAIEVTVNSKQDSIAMNPQLRKTIHQSCEMLGYTHKDIDSGAGHDAMVFSSRWPTAMIFIPCVKGVTHNPAEHVEPEFLKKGTDILYQTILKLDNQKGE